VLSDALTAYNNGATGKGVKIGIVDSGINPNLSEFAGRIDPASGDVAGKRGVSDEGGHGTAVSAVAAAGRNNSNTMGVAFDATIVSLRADAVGSCASTDGCTFYDDAIANGIDAARLAGVKVINLSLGGSTPGTALLAAMQRAVNAGIVIVIAAGNDGTPSPDPFALTPATKFAGMVIIAGAIDGNSQIASFSDRAGTGADYYLTALGVDDRAPDQNGVQFLWSGTSFAAPTITGAVALMAQAFPNLTGKEIVELLFGTADDLGATGVDTIYGHGKLNIGRAFMPVGATTLAASATPVNLADNGDLPGAAGDAATAQSMGAIILDGYSRAYVLNLARTLHAARQESPLEHSLRSDLSVGRASAGPLSIAMTVRERRDLEMGFEMKPVGIGPDDARKARLVAGSAIARVDQKTAIAFGFSEGAKAMERRLNGIANPPFLVAHDIAAEPGFTAKRNGSIALRRQVGSLGVTVSAETGDVWQDIRTSATGSPYRWTSIAINRPLGRNSLSVGVSRLEEQQSLLGGRMSAALGGGGSTSLFLDAEARHSFGSGITAGVTARRGWTDFAAGKFQTDAYVLDLAKLGLFTRHDALALRFAQPLRVEQGGFAMWLPTSYDYATRTAQSSYSTMSLTPKGREVDTELSYGSSLLDGNGWFGGNLFYRRDPGHIADSKDDVGAALRFTLDF
jgi:hypothetical protein